MNEEPLAQRTQRDSAQHLTEIGALLDAVISELADDSTVFPPEPIASIPTLDSSVFKALSPQIAARFARLGAWHGATHGDWLSGGELSAIAAGGPVSERLRGLVANLRAAAEHWEGDVAGRLDPASISYFAASAYTSERIYLVWAANRVEPELYVYDINGESVFEDLRAYLTDFLEDN